MHAAINDHSRMAYPRVYGDDTAAIAAGARCPAVGWLAEPGMRDVAPSRFASKLERAALAAEWGKSEQVKSR